MVCLSGERWENLTLTLSEGGTVRMSGAPSVPWESGGRPPGVHTMLTIILIVLVVLLLFGGGGFWYRGRG